MGLVLQAQGRLEEARAQYEQYLAKSRALGFRFGEAIALHNIGNVLLESGDTASARESFGESLSICDAIGFVHLAAATHLALGSIMREQGEESLALASLAKALEEASSMGAPGLEMLACCELALLPGGDWKEAARSFASAEKYLDAGDRIQARWLLWKASGEREHLAEAQRLLQEMLSPLSAEDRATSLARRWREVAEAG